jgi:hypothetical protein
VGIGARRIQLSSLVIRTHAKRQTSHRAEVDLARLTQLHLVAGVGADSQRAATIVVERGGGQVGTTVDARGHAVGDAGPPDLGGFRELRVTDHLQLASRERSQALTGLSHGRRINHRGQGERNNETAAHECLRREV